MEDPPRLPRPAYKHLPRLQYDIAAVLCGLRRCALIDYTRLPPDALVALVNHVARHLQLPGGAAVLVHEGCLYVGHRGLLLQALDDLPLLVQFVKIDGQAAASAAWAGAGDAEAFRLQLIALQAALSQGQAAPDTSSGSNQLAGARAGLQRAQCTVVELDQVAGLPLLPSLNGWLLGYPVVYLVRTREEAEGAARCLSSSVLQLHQVQTSCSSSMATGQQQAHWQTTPSSEAISQLCAFSVPEQLCGDVLRAKVQAWMSKLCAAAAAASVPAAAGTTWDEPKLLVSSVGPQPIVL